MKLFVVQVANGNLSTISEWTDNEDGAIMAWHAQCRALRGDKDTTKYICRIVDENLTQYQGFAEFCDRTPIPEPQYIEIVDPNETAKEGQTYYVLIDGSYVEDTGIQVGDRVYGKYIRVEPEE